MACDGIEVVTRFAAAVVAAVVLVPAAPAESFQAAPPKVQRVLKRVFGKRWREAERVAWCESRFKPWARNGQYLGILQMGSWERRTYGHGRTVLQQARAAHRYWVATGRTWRPWECRYMVGGR